MSRRKTHRRDNNHRKLTQHARSLGGYVVDVSQTDCGFDLLIAYRGRTIAVEAKNPEYLAKKLSPKDALLKAIEKSDNEKTAYEEFKARNCEYYILATCDQLTQVMLPNGKLKINYSNPLQ